MPPVSEHMSRDLLTVEPDLTLAEAARRMVERRVGAVVILEGDHLAGILTERDILRSVASGFREEARVSESMTRRPETIEPSDTTEHAAVLMLHGGFRHLPVVDEGHVVGILSIRDLMSAVLEDQAPRGV